MSPLHLEPNVRRRELAVFYSLLAMGIYSLRRIVDCLSRPEPNPVTVIYSPHSAYLWRVTWALLVASFGAIAWSLVGVRSRKIVRGMFFLVLAIAIVQTLWFP